MNTPETEELKLLVETQYGRVLNTTTDFEEFSLHMSLKTGKNLSSSTLKRLWDYVGDSHKPRIGTLDIPRLNISLPIMSEWSDAKLKTAPCRYAGTAYRSGFVISGHNYRRHFGPLGRIAPGDRVTFTDVDGNVFAYNVAEIQVLKPTAIEDMLSEKWDLSLFTCTLGGQTRLTVRCEKAETGA